MVLDHYIPKTWKLHLCFNVVNYAEEYALE